MWSSVLAGHVVPTVHLHQTVGVSVCVAGQMAMPVTVSLLGRRAARPAGRRPPPSHAPLLLL